VSAGEFTEAGAEQYLGDVLLSRREAIGRAYLTAINPVVDPALSATGVLTFGNAAVQHGFATPPQSYQAVWSTFDNATGATTLIGHSEGPETSLPAPSAFGSTAAAFVRVEVSATSTSHPSWAQPVTAYFRRGSAGWTLVGFERLPDRPAPAEKGPNASW
jgi:hypothetical protein